MAVSEAKKRANAKYDSKAYKRITVRIPRTLEMDVNERIGNGSFNNYVMELIKKDLGITDNEKGAD